MASRTDHDRRDAQHAARLTTALELERYKRRILEEAYTRIEQEATEYDGGVVDWSAVGIAAAHQALGSYGISVGPSRVIDADAVAELPAGAPELPEAA